MRFNTIDEMIEICQAIKDGKEIEYYNRFSREWASASLPVNFAALCYRIKPEEPKKKWRPFKDVDEFLKAAGGLGAIWLKCKFSNSMLLVTAIDGRDCCNPIRLTAWVGFSNLFDDFTFADGTPCGVEEGE